MATSNPRADHPAVPRPARPERRDPTASTIPPGGDALDRAPYDALEHTVKAQVDERVRDAIVASSRAEASLSNLFRAIEDASSGLTGARQANEVLIEELVRVREELRTTQVANERSRSELARQQAEYATERQRSAQHLAALLDEHDTFIASLLDDHDLALAALRTEHEAALAAKDAELVALRQDRDEARDRHEQLTRAAEAGRAARERLQATSPGIMLASDGLEAARLKQKVAELEDRVVTLVRERERSREMLRRLQSQRDEATREASELRRSLTPAPIPIPSPDLAESAPAAADELTTKPPPADYAPAAPKVTVRERSVLAEVLAATDPKRRQAEPRAPAAPKPPLRPREVSARPEGGYSVANVPPENTSSRPPRR